MITSAIPARLEFQCGHAALVSLPRIKGESSSQRNDRIAREKLTAQSRPCDFCAPAVVLQPVPAEPILMAADTAADEIILSPEVEKVIASATERLASESSSNGSASPASATPERKRRGRKPRVAPVSTLNGTTTLAAATPVVAAIGAPDSAATPVRKRRGRPPGSKNAVSRSAVPAASSATTATTAQATPATTAAKRRGRKPRAAVISLAPTPVAAKRNGVAATPRSITRTSFTVHYVVDVTIVASDIGDALRQAQARGATEVLAVTAN